jgi:hypothetical protein
MLNTYVLRLARGMPRGNNMSRAGQDDINSKRPHPQKTKVKRLTGVLCAAIGAAGVLLLANTVSAQSIRLSRDFNKPGNILIADQFNNRVIEINPTGNILWSFGRGPNDFTAKSIIGVNDVQRVGAFTLMAGTGTPA